MAAKAKSKMKMMKLIGLNEKIETVDGIMLVDSNGPLTTKKLIAQVLMGARTPEDAVPAFKLALRIYDEEDEALFTSTEMDLIRKCSKSIDNLANQNRAIILIALEEAEEVEVEEAHA